MRVEGRKNEVRDLCGSTGSFPGDPTTTSLGSKIGISERFDPPSGKGLSGSSGPEMDLAIAVRGVRGGDVAGLISYTGLTETVGGDASLGVIVMCGGGFEGLGSH